jgi:hypothetical protein
MSEMAPASSTPVGPAAHDHELERRVGPGLQLLPLGQLKRQQDTAADLGGVLNGLEPRRELGPVVVAEVAVRGAGGEDEVVVEHLRAALQANAPRHRVDVQRLVHHHLRVAGAAEDAADGLRDVSRRKHSQRHLVQQRLKGMVVGAVDHGDVNGQLAQPLRRGDAGESSADDDDARAGAFRVHAFGQGRHFCRCCCRHGRSSPSIRVS